MLLISGRAHGHHGATGFTCAPASETFKLPGRRMLEPISLRFDPSREKEAADRRHWCERPEASLCHRSASSSNRGVPALLINFPEFYLLSRSGFAGHVRHSRTYLKFRRDGRTLPRLITRDTESRFVIMLQLRR